jgi:GNAT superfamily N-acetyltransferase
MAVRAATEGDLPALLVLLRGYCDFYEMSPSDEGLERVARGVIAAPEEEAFLLVATDDDGEVVGIAVCVWSWSSLHGGRIVNLNDLFVAESARGAGHADALIQATAEVARRHGGESVNWLTATDNRRAQAVYDRVGAKYSTFREYELEL